MKKLLTSLLVIPFLLANASCGQGKEISVEQATEIVNQIETYLKQEVKEENFSRKITSHSQLLNTDDEDIDIKIDIEYKKNNKYMYADFYYYVNDKETQKEIDYTYQNGDKYYTNGVEITSEKYNKTQKNFSSITAASSYLDSVKIDLGFTSIASMADRYKFYSNGDGNITVVETLDVSSKEYVYTSTTTYKFDNYKFVSYEFISEKTTPTQVEKQHRTETVKYHTPIIISTYK